MGLLAVGPLVALLRPDASYARVFVAGVLVGLLLEVLQLLLASGNSQGLSIVARGVGSMVGVAAGKLLVWQGPLGFARVVRRTSPFVVPAYAVVLAAVNGWFSHAWIPVGEALSRLSHVKLMPFYYHYFSTEPAAMASLLANVAMYAPVGVFVWARRVSRLRSAGDNALASALLAAFLATFIELGKLFVPLKHPDFTSLLIAAVAAALSNALATWGERVLGGSPPHGSTRRKQRISASYLLMNTGPV